MSSLSSLRNQSDAGVLGRLPVRLALGLLRLCTEGRPAESDAVALIHYALSHGIRVLDTADSYCLDQKEFHYGERLARYALDTWPGPRAEVRILTKVGLTRPTGRWVPNGKPDWLKQSVDESLIALGVERLFMLQLHAKDPRVPLEETLGCLAELQRAGKVEHIGLCNVVPLEIRQAMRHFPVTAVQQELGVLSRKAASEGLVALTESEQIPLLAYRPLNGVAKRARIAKNKVLTALAERRGQSPHQVAIAALLDAAPHVVPLFGATRLASVQSSIAATQISFDVSDRAVLQQAFPFTSSPEATATLAKPRSAESVPALEPNVGPGNRPEVVLLMGIQGAGKSQLVQSYVDAGYLRLNRDLIGGKLDDLTARLGNHLAAGETRVVLDNTYPTRLSRAAVIITAHAHGIPVRCRHLATPLPEAQFNVVMRMIERYGRPLSPEEMKACAKTDPNLPPPAALARWTSSFEAPSLDEGFAAVDVIPFCRRLDPSHQEKGLLLDVDGTIRTTKSGELYPRSADDVQLLPGRRAILEPWLNDGYKLFFVSNQSGIASGKLSRLDAEAAFLRTAELLQLPVTEVAYCPHPAFPVSCFCRKPLPGLGAYLMHRHRLARSHVVVVGDMASDEQFAAGIGARYIDVNAFFP